MLYLVVGGEKSPAKVAEFFSPLLSGSTIPASFCESPTPTTTLKAGDVVLLMGTGGLVALKETGHVKKNATLTSLREAAWKYGEGRAMVTYSLGYGDKDPEALTTIAWDTRLAVRLHQTGGLKPDLSGCSYQYVDDFWKIVAYLDKFTEAEPLALSLDLETIGLDPWAPGCRIVSVQVSPKEGVGRVLYVPDSGQLSLHALESLRRLITDPRVRLIGANLKFDIVWLRHHWGLKVRNHWADTFLMGSLLNENMRNSLELQAKVHTPIGGYDGELNSNYDKSRMDLIPKEDLLTYAAGDVDACFRVYNVQRGALSKQPRLLRFYKRLVHPASAVFATLERRGVVADVDRYAEVRAIIAQAMGEAEKKALDMVPRKLKLKYSDNLSLTRPVLIRDMMFGPQGLGLSPQLFTEKSEEKFNETGDTSVLLASTAEEHLASFADDEGGKEFVTAYLDYMEAKKVISTFIDGWLAHLRSDGRFHPSYILGHSDVGGTVSGRSACKNPGWQTLIKHGQWADLVRSCLPAPPGMVILKDDFAQGELKICACVTGDSTMLTAFKQGIDLHLKTGAAMNHISLAKAQELMASLDPAVKKMIKAVRQGGKVGNFGLIYRISPEGLVQYAWGTYKVRLTVPEATAFKKAFFELYPGIGEWHEFIVRKARKELQVESPLGRVRHLPLINSYAGGVRGMAERMAINSPIQSTLSDMKVLGMVELARRYPDLWQYGFTHDETQYYVPEDDVDLWAGRIREVNENLPLEQFGWHPQLKFTVDIQVGKTLSSCKELHV